MGVAYERLKKYTQALEYYQKALQMQQALHEGENHADVAAALREVGDAYKRLGQHEQAREYDQQAFQMQQALPALPPGSAAFPSTVGRLGRDRTRNRNPYGASVLHLYIRADLPTNDPLDFGSARIILN